MVQVVLSPHCILGESLPMKQWRSWFLSISLARHLQQASWRWVSSTAELSKAALMRRRRLYELREAREGRGRRRMFPRALSANTLREREIGASRSNGECENPCTIL